MMNITGGHLSKEFFDLVKSIGESRSKQEEDRIVVAEALTLKQRLSEPNVSSSKMKEYLIRSLYVEMLGHNASFSYIHAVKLAQDKNLVCKRIGYLIASLCLNPKHELLLLLINTIQKDLGSSNYLEVAAALTCICKLLNDEMIPVVFPEIIRLLRDHPNELVRRKCCMALHAVYRIQPRLVTSEAGPALRRALCDSDPGVMAASLHLIHTWARQDSETWIDLIPSIVSILKQVTENRLPRDYDYHRVPAPWTQVKLLSLLATLGEGNKNAADQMSEVLIEVIRRAEACGNVGFAIIYEAVKTATTIPPSSRLLEIAATAISRFVAADNHNLKYVGISGLANIVRVHPSFAARPEHQLIVVDCLEDADDTLRRRTLDLLFRMTNPVNVTAVIDKLLLHLRLSVDSDFRRDLASKICRLADRYAPSHAWYVRIINEVLELGGGTLVPATTTHNLLRLIAEGPTGQDDEDKQFRREVVTHYITSLEHGYETLPEPLMRVACWVVGEYGPLNTLKEYSGIEKLIDLLCKCMERTYEDSLVPLWIMSAIMKLSILRLLTVVSQGTQDFMSGATHFGSNTWPERHVRLTPAAILTIGQCLKAKGTHLEQRCLEFQALILKPSPGSDFSVTEHVLREVFPYDASCEDIVVQSDLPFLNSYVKREQLRGAEAYARPDQRQCHYSITHSSSTQRKISLQTDLPLPSTSLKFTPYEAPPRELPSLGISQQPKLTSTTSPLSEPPQPAEVTFQVPGPRRWGPHGYEGYNPAPGTSSNSAAPAGRTDARLTSEGGTPMGKRESLQAPKLLEPRKPSEKEIIAQALFGGLVAVHHDERATDPVTVPASVGVKGSERKDSAENNRSSSQVVSTDLLDLDGVSEKRVDGTSPRLLYNNDGERDLCQTVTSVSDATTGATAAPPQYLPDTEVILTAPGADLMFGADTTPRNSSEKIYGSSSATTALPALQSGKILEPLVLDTASVGAQWPRLSAEKRASFLVPPSLSAIHLLFQRLQDVLNVSTVEIIGNEGIAAGRVITTFDNDVSALHTPVFVHASLHHATINIILKGVPRALVIDLQSRSHATCGPTGLNGAAFFFDPHAECFNCSCIDLLPPEPNAPTFPDLAKAEYLLPFHVQRTNRGSLQGVPFHKASSLERVRIVRNKELREHLRTKALAKRQQHKKQQIKELRSITCASTPVLLLLEECTHRRKSISVRLQSSPCNTKFLSGIPIMFTTAWDIILTLSETPHSLVGSEIVYITRADQ